MSGELWEKQEKEENNCCHEGTKTRRLEVRNQKSEDKRKEEESRIQKPEANEGTEVAVVNEY